MKSAHILGLNARAQEYSYPHNHARGKSIATSKLWSKQILRRAGIPVPETYGKFSDPTKVERFNWDSLPGSFVLKPNRGFGGEGIIVVKKKAKDGDGWITTSKKRVHVEDLKLHCMDIMEGAYSLGNVPDKAFIEEFVGRHKSFRKFAYRGTPDIRIIVFNKVPIMAMLRLPTKESGGRANIHQGAIAVGIDIATGITTHAIYHDRYIKEKPGTKRKLHGIKIPKWDSILESAVKCQEVTGIGYLSADFVLHPEKGPMILELNYQPGLRIQMANKAGLKRRLERVEDLNVVDAQHGVKIAKSLFASNFADRVKAEEGIRTVEVLLEVKIKSKDGRKMTIPAKIDTGAWRTSIDRTLAKDLGLLSRSNILWKKRVRSSMGREKRSVIDITFWLAKKKIKTTAGVSDRSKLKRPIIIGRQDLTGFLIDPSIKNNEK